MPSCIRNVQFQMLLAMCISSPDPLTTSKLGGKESISLSFIFFYMQNTSAADQSTTSQRFKESSNTSFINVSVLADFRSQISHQQNKLSSRQYTEYKTWVPLGKADCVSTPWSLLCTHVGAAVSWVVKFFLEHCYLWTNSLGISTKCWRVLQSLNQTKSQPQSMTYEKAPGSIGKRSDVIKIFPVHVSFTCLSNHGVNRSINKSNHPQTFRPLPLPTDET